MIRVDVGRGYGWRGGWSDRVAGPALAAAPLGLCAVAESFARVPAPGTRLTLQLVLLVGLLALTGTLPLALPAAAPAALAVTAAGVLSLTPFHAPTVAGACAQLIVLHRLGRGSAHLAAALPALPYLVLAL